MASGKTSGSGEMNIYVYAYISSQSKTYLKDSKVFGKSEMLSFFPLLQVLFHKV